MALKTIMLRHEIERKEAELAAMREKDADFQTREAELEAAIAEVQTDEERGAMETEISAFETERDAHSAAVTELEGQIEELRGRLTEAEKMPPMKPQAAPADNERSDTAVLTNINIRSLPMNQRAFDALPYQERQRIVAQDDTQTFLKQLRSMKGQTRAVEGGELTIPIVFLDLIAQNMYRYSKLLNRVRVRNVSGQARQTIAGIVPEAVWTEMCGIINELTFKFYQNTLDGYKVAGFIPVCNSLLEDNDVNLASWIVEMLSESIGLALDKAILYGKGPSYHMPQGIVPRLAQTSKPESYPANAPDWVDLHSTNLISIASNKTGAEFWAALTVAAGNTFTKYARGTQFWCMNSKTYALLKSKAITFTASGDVVANVYGLLPIVTGDIDILEFMPDNDIVGGYGDLYLLGERAGMTIEASREVQFIQDNTVFKGKMSADGMPIIAGAFVAINIAGSSPASSMLFAGDDANTVSGLLLNTATAAITGTGTFQLEAIPLPFGVDAGTITWASATTAKATVSSTGLVTGVASGSSVITATCNGYTAQCTVTVT